MSSEEKFDDTPLADIGEKEVAQAQASDRVFDRSSAAPGVVIPSAASMDDFPDEPEPITEPMPEPQPLDAEFVDPHIPQDAALAESALGTPSSYGLSDPASLAAVGSGELKDPELVEQVTRDIAQATLGTSSGPEVPHLALVPSPALHASELSLGRVLQPHLAHLAQVGLTHSDTWDEQIKPRIEHLQGQILEINDRLDHLTTQKYR